MIGRDNKGVKKAIADAAKATSLKYHLEVKIYVVMKFSLGPTGPPRWALDMSK